MGQDQGKHFIATEFIDGVTLRQKLSAGPLKLPEALGVACQVALALTTAHEARIIHRDIKPENIMLRRDRIVKVLDFGLAKLTETTPAALDTGAPTKDPELREFYRRIYDRHPKKVAARKAIVAVARKLTTRIYAVLKEQRPFVLRPDSLTAPLTAEETAGSRERLDG